VCGHRKQPTGSAIVSRTLIALLVLTLATPVFAGANDDFVAGVAAYKKKDYAAAELSFRKALAGDDKNPQFRLRLAKAVYKQKRYDEAVKVLKRLLAQHPKMASARYQMALVQRKAGLLDDAVISYTGYIKLVTKDPDGYYGLAETYTLRGEPQLAIANYEKYVELEKRPGEQKYVAAARMKVGELKAAISASAKPLESGALKAVKKKASSVKNVGVAAPYIQKIARQAVAQGDGLLGEKKLAAAAEAFRDAALRDPKNLEARFKLGTTLAALGDMAGAQDAFEAALALDPQSAPIKGNLERVKGLVKAQPTAASNGLDRGVALLNKGKFQAALPLLDTYVKAQPDDAAGHVARGSALLSLQKTDEALRAYGQALVLRPDLSLAHFGLGEVYRLQGDLKRATDHFKSYLSSAGADRNPLYDDVAKGRISALGSF
jgi:tetratricopeptide (TPR) repeat protein